MSQDQSAPPPERDPRASERAERRGPPPNPLYHPLFLPVLLVAFALWFGYDGFLTTDPTCSSTRASTGSCSAS
ncbi:MAG: hypothetical protein R3E53_14935 [Myxococcota bacterium]